MWSQHDPPSQEPGALMLGTEWALPNDLELAGPVYTTLQGTVDTGTLDALYARSSQQATYELPTSNATSPLLRNLHAQVVQQQLLPQLSQDPLYLSNQDDISLASGQLASGQVSVEQQQWDAWGLPGWYSAPGVLVQTADHQHQRQRISSQTGEQLLLLQQLEQQQQQATKPHQREVLVNLQAQPDQADQLLVLQRQLQQLQALQQAQQQQAQQQAAQAQLQEEVLQLQVQQLQQQQLQQQQQELVLGQQGLVIGPRSGGLSSGGLQGMQNSGQLIQLQQPTGSTQLWLNVQQQQQQSQQQQQVQLQQPLQVEGLLPSAALSGSLGAQQVQQQQQQQNQSRAQVERLMASISLNRTARTQMTQPQGQAQVTQLQAAQQAGLNVQGGAGARLLGQQLQLGTHGAQLLTAVLPNNTSLMAQGSNPNSGTALLASGNQGVSVNAAALGLAGGSSVAGLRLAGANPNAAGAALGAQGLVLQGSGGLPANNMGNLSSVGLGGLADARSATVPPAAATPSPGAARMGRSTMPSLTRLPVSNSGSVQQLQQQAASAVGAGAGGPPRSGALPAPRHPLSGPAGGRYLHSSVRAQPPSWAGADWNPRAAVPLHSSSSGTGVFLPQMQRPTSSSSVSQPSTPHTAPASSQPSATSATQVAAAAAATAINAMATSGTPAVAAAGTTPSLLCSMPEGVEGPASGPASEAAPAAAAAPL